MVEGSNPLLQIFLLAAHVDYLSQFGFCCCEETSWLGYCYPSPSASKGRAGTKPQHSQLPERAVLAELWRSCIYNLLLLCKHEAIYNQWKMELPCGEWRDATGIVITDIQNCAWHHVTLFLKSVKSVPCIKWLSYVFILKYSSKPQDVKSSERMHP